MVPISTTLLLSACGARAENRCVFHDIFPDYLFFECPSVGDYFSYLWQEQVWLWALWFISQIWITGHSKTTCTKLITTLTLHPLSRRQTQTLTFYIISTLCRVTPPWTFYWPLPPLVHVVIECPLTAHIWFPKTPRLASTEQIFGTPMYCSLVIDQSIVFNR